MNSFNVVHPGFGQNMPVHNITITLHYIILNESNKFVVLQLVDIIIRE